MSGAPLRNAASPTRNLVGATISIVVSGLSLYACMTMLSHQRYDREDPDYRYIVGQVSEAGRPKTLDLSKINGGDWQVLCVIGSYKNAGQVLRDEAGRRQIELDSIDRDLVFLDDPESAVAFVDGSGRGRIILIGAFQHLTSQHTHQCFGPETREIVLPLR